jgi:uncharacterized protein YkwD
MTSKLRHPALKLVALVMVTLLVASACMDANQRKVFNQVNNSRTSRGIPAMGDNAWMSNYAQDWAEHMARTGRLAHSNFSAHNPYRWRALAENVGVGTSLTSVHNGFINSPPHRANILNRRYNYLGTGAAYGHGRWWVVHEFMQY